MAKLEPFSMSISKGFKKKHCWWPVMDMAYRYFFVVIVVSTVGNKASVTKIWCLDNIINAVFAGPIN